MKKILAALLLSVLAVPASAQFIPGIELIETEDSRRRAVRVSLRPLSQYFHRD